MRQYKIYGNPQGQLEAVKQGWSWPAFFFNAIWALVKKMWALGGILFAVFFAFGFISASIGRESGQALDALTSIANFIVAIVFGMNGNKWREKNLTSRGYEFQDTVNAANPEGAVAVYIKEHPTT